MASVSNTPQGTHPSPRPVVALIEDDPDLVAMSRHYLERDGFRVLSATDVQSGLAIVDSADLVTLDLCLPDGSGLELLQTIRRSSALPVIIVTGRGEEPDRVVGLELGADDYLVKPFSQRELAARIRAVLRRAGRTPGSDVLRVGSLRIDISARQIQIEGKQLTLAYQEYALLEFLAHTPGRTYSPEQLLQQVWDSSDRWQTAATVTEHVYRLRRKLLAEGVTTPRITTVRGYGYRLDL